MGNSFLGQSLLGDSVSEYELLLEDPDHNLKFLEHIPTKQELVLRQVILNQFYLRKNMLQTLLNKEYKLKHPHLFQIVKYNQILQSHNCNSAPRIIIMSEYSQRTIDDETSQRYLQRNPYSQQQLWTILASCILAFRHLQKSNIRHECLKSAEIFISHDGLIKIKDPITTGTLPNIVQLLKNRNTPHIYLSPELCDSLSMSEPDHTYDSHKSDVFTLAMIILEIGLLQYQDACYKSDCTMIDWVKLENNWMKFNKLYSPHLSEILIDCMLEKNPKMRNSWQDLQINIKRFDQQQKQKSMLNKSTIQKTTIQKRYQDFNNKSNIKQKVVRINSSQSPPFTIVSNISPRIIHRRANYHHQKTISSNFQSNLVVHKSASNSPTFHPLKVINRKIPIQQQVFMNKPLINTRVINLQNSVKKKLISRPPQSSFNDTTKFVKRIKDFRQIPTDTVSFDKTIKYFTNNQIKP